MAGNSIASSIGACYGRDVPRVAWSHKQTDFHPLLFSNAEHFNGFVFGHHVDTGTLTDAMDGDVVFLRFFDDTFEGFQAFRTGDFYSILGTVWKSFLSGLV